MVATNRWIWDDQAGELTNTHPLRHMFRRDRLIDLVADGHHFQGSAPAAFFRRDRLEREGDPLRRPDQARLRGRPLHDPLPALLRPADGRVPPVGAVPLPQAQRRQLDAADLARAPRALPPDARARPARRRAPGTRAPRGGAQLAAVAPRLRPVLVLHPDGLAGTGRVADQRAGGGTDARVPRRDHHAPRRRHLRAGDADPHPAHPSLRHPARVRRSRPGTSPSCCSPSSTAASCSCRRRTSSPASSRSRRSTPRVRWSQPLHAKTVDYAYAGRVLLRRRVLWVAVEPQDQRPARRRGHGGRLPPAPAVPGQGGHARRHALADRRAPRAAPAASRARSSSRSRRRRKAAGRSGCGRARASSAATTTPGC